MKLSIIIPVLNEQESIQSMLLPLQYLRTSGHEVILVDGGSVDNTIIIATPLVDKLIKSEKGRAKQQNKGAEIARGDYFVFLHADTLLPPSFESDLLTMSRKSDLSQTNKVNKHNNWGRFNVQLSGEHWLFSVIAFFMNWRSCLTGIATGDQVIFMSSSVFKQLGGFPDIPLMEDIAMSQRLKQTSKPYCMKSYVVTSSRRWEKKGILKTIILMWQCRLYYFFGVSPESLHKKYYG